MVRTGSLLIKKGNTTELLPIQKLKAYRPKGSKGGDPDDSDSSDDDEAVPKGGKFNRLIKALKEPKNREEVEALSAQELNELQALLLEKGYRHVQREPPKDRSPRRENNIWTNLTLDVFMVEDIRENDEVIR